MHPVSPTTMLAEIPTPHPLSPTGLGPIHSITPGSALPTQPSRLPSPPAPCPKQPYNHAERWARTHCDYCSCTRPCPGGARGRVPRSHAPRTDPCRSARKRHRRRLGSPRTPRSRNWGEKQGPVSRPPALPGAGGAAPAQPGQ